MRVRLPRDRVGGRRAGRAPPAEAGDGQVEQCQKRWTGLVLPQNQPENSSKTVSVQSRMRQNRSTAYAVVGRVLVIVWERRRGRHAERRLADLDVEAEPPEQSRAASRRTWRRRGRRRARTTRRRRLVAKTSRWSMKSKSISKSTPSRVHAPRRQAADVDVERNVPPVVRGARRRHPHLAHDLRPEVQRVFVSSQLSSGSSGSCRLTTFTSTLLPVRLRGRTLSRTSIMPAARGPAEDVAVTRVPQRRRRHDVGLRHRDLSRRPPARCRDRADIAAGVRLCEHVFGGRSRDDPARRPRRVLRVGRAARRPAPAGRPVIVGGGVVLAASYEAKAYGVRTAMGGRQARRLCPDAVVVPPRMSAYTEASKAVFEVFEDTTPLVEGLSIDEAFLDVGGLRRVAGTPTEIAVRLRAAGARAGRAAHHGRRRPHEVPGQGGERRGQARRAARRPARRRARVPAPAAGRAAVGRRPGDRREAARARHPHRRRGRAPARGGAACRCSAAAAGATSTPSPTTATPGRCRSAGGAGRSARSARSGRRAVAGEIDAALVGPRRPGHAPHARGRPRRAHGRAAPALRRLHPGDPLAHAAARDGATPQAILATARELLAAARR